MGTQSGCKCLLELLFPGSSARYAGSGNRRFTPQKFETCPVWGAKLFLSERNRPKAVLLSGGNFRHRGQNHLKRAIITAVFCLFLGACQQASAQIILGQSTQNLILTGVGPNASGDGVSVVTWGACSYDGTKTTCILSGPFTGLGPGGTYVYTLAYPGNGPSPLDAITAPGSDLFSISLSAGRLTFVFNESNGTSVSYNHSGSLFFVPGLTACTGNVTGCGPGSVWADARSNYQRAGDRHSRRTPSHPDRHLGGGIRRVHFNRPCNLDRDLRTESGDHNHGLDRGL